MTRQERLNPQGYSEPFPSQRVEAFMDCFGDRETQEEFFSARDPFFVAQQLMFCLHFFPNEPKDEFDAKLKKLNRCLSLTPNQIVERLSFKPQREKAINSAKERFLKRLGNRVAWETQLEQDNPLFFQDMANIYHQSGFELPYEQWRIGYLFYLWRYYGEAARFKIEVLTGASSKFQPQDLKRKGKEKLLPDESFFSNNQRGLNNWEYRTFFQKELENFYTPSIPGRMLVHGVTGMRLKYQIYLESFGDFVATNRVSLSRDRVFVPRRSFFADGEGQWAVFFDSREIKETGLPFLLGGGGLGTEEEQGVRILPPIDLSLSFGAFPIEIIESLGWEETHPFSYPNQKLLIIPEKFKDVQELVEELRVSFKDSFCSS